MSKFEIDIDLNWRNSPPLLEIFVNLKFLSKFEIPFDLPKRYFAIRPWLFPADELFRTVTFSGAIKFLCYR